MKGYLAVLPIALGLGLIAAYNRGENFAGTTLWDIAACALGIAVILGTIEMLVRLSYRLWPAKVDASSQEELVSVVRVGFDQPLDRVLDLGGGDTPARDKVDKYVHRLPR